MRVLAAVVLSVIGSVVSFLAVLGVLDQPDTPAVRGGSPTGAVAGLTSPAPISELGVARAASAARFAAPAILGETRIASPTPPTLVRSAHVPPIVRRKPVEPAASIEEILAQPAPKERAVAAAKPVRAKVPGSEEGATWTRSALGGPKSAPDRKAKPGPTP